MGYESKLYVIDKSDIFDANKMRFGVVVASFDLCKVHSVATDVRHYPKTDAYFYSNDGNTIITEDLYGKPLTEVPVPDMIQILERAANDGHYRRFKPCIQMLKGFDLSEWGNLVVLHYGH